MGGSLSLLSIYLLTIYLSVMIPAYDDPVVWEGHGSMVEEISRQLPKGVKPDAIFCSAGGGGLAGGIMVGCKNVGWDDGSSLLLRWLVID